MKKITLLIVIGSCVSLLLASCQKDSPGSRNSPGSSTSTDALQKVETEDTKATEVSKDITKGAKMESINYLRYVGNSLLVVMDSNHQDLKAMDIIQVDNTDSLEKLSVGTFMLAGLQEVDTTKDPITAELGAAEEQDIMGELQIDFLAAEKLMELHEDTILLDVRSKEEFASGHIKGAVLLPLDKIQDIATTTEDKEQLIILYCRSGNRSGQAYNILTQMGYKNMFNAGGILSYEGEIVK